MTGTGIFWTNKETAIAIVFSTWGYGQEVIARLLNSRRAPVRGVQQGLVAGLLSEEPQYIRTAGSVRQKLHRL
jgi:hypothetical protein